MNSPLVPPSQILSSQSSVPQIRSRITVVCAECKRLKLKCDRRNPCGSCTKRDTVSRCIYSPAAAEKVDLHSLNNRLIQVEATLSLITAGQTPPAFQSSYPYSQIQPNTVPNVAISHSLNSTPTGLSHQHHHHHSATFSSANGSISLSSDDLSSIWLDELDELDSPPFDVKISRPLKTDAGSVKLETSSYAYFNIVDENTSQLLPQATHIHIDLPHISVYYTAPERMSETQQMPTSASCVPPQSDTFNGTTPTSKPSITPSLVALLPSYVRTRQLLRKAAGVLCERPVPLPASLLSSLSDGISGAGVDANGRNNIKGKKGKNKTYFPSLTTHWDALELRVMCLITNCGLGRGTLTKTTDRKEKEKMSARARAIFFGGGSPSAASNTEPPLTPQSRTQNPKRDNESEVDATERSTKERSETLPFFAAVCLLLAMGTIASQTTDNEGSDSHADTPGQLSTGSETESPEFFYALAQQSLDVWENNMTSLSVPNAEDKEAMKAEEDEKLDYLVASLLTVGYQLYEPFARRKGKDSERCRINALNKAFSSVGKMVNMARAMGLGKDRKSPVRCKDEPNAKETLEAKKKVRAEERRKRKDDLRRLIWWDIGFYELFISDALGHSSLLSSSPCLVQFPRCAGFSPSNDEIESGQEDAQQEPKSNQDEEFSVQDIVGKYHGARCRLTKIAQTIKQKLAHPDCCCGYTLDQAAQLEGEVNRFLEGLPPSLRFFKEEGKEITMTRSQDMQPSTTDEAQHSMQRSQCCELAIMSQRLIMMAYLPFLRQHSESRSSNFSSAAVTATLSDHSTGQKSDDSAWNPALQSTVNAAQCIIQASKTLLQWPISDRPSDQLFAPSLLDLYPLEKTLLDAVIICTHAATFHGTLFSYHQAIEYASSALEMLLGMDLDPNHKTLLERVKKRFNITVQNREPSSLYGIKRKHNSIGAEGRGRGAEASKSHTYSSYPSTEVQLTGGRPSQQATQNGMPADLMRPGSVCNGRDPETGQKNKKHAKKNHPYPAVGIRVRQRKDGLPLFLKDRFNSPSTSTPNPGRESSAETLQQERRVQMNPIVTPVDEQDLSLGDFGPSQHQQSPQEGPTPPVMSSLLDDPRYQSGSTSLNQDLHLHHTQSQHESRPAAVAYSAAYIEMYEQGQKLSSQEVQMSSSHSDSFDGNKNHDASSAFNHVSHISAPVESNPYGSSRHLSASSSSPYLASGSGMTPLTPFRPAAQTIMSSPYTQEPTASSNSHTHSYYHPEASYSGVVDHPESTPPYGSMGLDASTETSTPIIRATSSTGLSNSAFEETHGAMYDVKVPLEGLIHPQIHHHHMLQHPPYNVDQPPVLHLPSPMGQSQAWAHHNDSCSTRYWDTPASSTGEYKFIH